MDSSNMVPAAVEILGVTPGEHTVTVDMNEAFLDGSGQVCLGTSPCSTS